MAFLISEPETEAMVRQYAQQHGLGLTEAVNSVFRAAGASSNMEGALLDRAVRDDLRVYLDALARKTGKRRGGSRVYAMLNRWGPVEAVRRCIFKHNPSGLEQCAVPGRPRNRSQRSSEAARGAVCVEGSGCPLLVKD